MTELFPEVNVEEFLGVLWLRNLLGHDRVGNELIDVQTEAKQAKLRDGWCVVTQSGEWGPMDSVTRKPIYTIEVNVAPAEGSSQAPWGRAGGIATRINEMVRYRAPGALPCVFDIPGYGPVVASAPYIVRSATKMMGDGGGNAVYTTDIPLAWRRA